MREAFELLHEGVGIHSLRKRMHLPGSSTAWGNLLSLMPAYYNEDYCGAKVFTVYPDNSGTSLPTHQGLVLLFNSHNGSLLACADAHAITEIRTAATSALATDILARKDASVVSFIGAGTQAYSHLISISLIRNISEVIVFDLNKDRALDFASYAANTLHIPAYIAKNPQNAAQNADVINTMTTSSIPILNLRDVIPGTHLNAIGACAPVFRELSTDLVVASQFYGDCSEAVYSEAGDFIIPLKEHAITESHLRGDLSDLVSGKNGRKNDEEITIFKSLGIATEDIAAIKYIYEKRIQQHQV